MSKTKKPLEQYDLVWYAKSAKFAIYTGTIEIFTFFGLQDLAMIYPLPDSVQTIEAFNEFVDKIKRGSFDVIMQFNYCETKHLHRAKEYSKKNALLLKVKFSG